MNRKIFQYILLIIVLAIILTDSIIRSDNVKYVIKSESQFYEFSFSGIVRRKWINRGMVIRLEDSTGLQKITFPSSSNSLYSPSELYFFIEKGDSVYKSSNSDKINIIRGEQIYYFIAGKDI